MESLFSQAYTSAESDRGAALRHCIYGETLGLEPCRHLAEIVLAHAELLSKLRGGEPLMVAGRRRSLLRRQQSSQARLLRREPVSMSTGSSPSITAELMNTESG